MVRRDFECTQCGNCCPTKEFCKHRVGNLCDVHPSIVGEERGFWERGLGCENPPWAIAGHWGFFCPPVMGAFEEATDITLHPLRQNNGTVVIEEWLTEPDKAEKLHEFVGANHLFSRKNCEEFMKTLRERNGGK